ncbi:hypothetical protein BN1058_00919 [Paraliobacillus sp. PM-2]|uniref:DUF6123 family protein n=1 Tax=Paraliobacillus sp. PM-2 TaxID=1462524 RepID=UPI00061C89E9|nr:DUF6123 family protein [Paraliobacillus sp. PM-2]CQR46649.1 hypothetical protein BN1058_00919 [Paraliobacillus sp. PM-2]
MPKASSLADFIEVLWEKGFKLSDEEVHFIYFGKRYTEASDQLNIIALKYTIQIQLHFDRSFYISLLELLMEHKIKNEKQARTLFQQKGIL